VLKSVTSIFSMKAILQIAVKDICGETKMPLGRAVPVEVSETGATAAVTPG
jgi:hypothetical protein